SVQAWPMQHPELAVIGWSALLLAVFAPLAVHLYRRKAGGWPPPPAACPCAPAAGGRPADRWRPAVSVPGPAGAGRLLPPPRAVARGDLGVDDQGPVPRPGQPLAHRRQVLRAADGHPGAAETAADGGDVGGREADRVQRVPVRPEVMHLGAVRLVVV